MDKKDVLALETRRTIYQTLRQTPGLHMRALQRLTDVPLSTLRYHLRFLEDHGLVTVRREDQYKRYYAAEDVSRHDKPILALLRREKPRRILLKILERGSTMWYHDLRAELGYPESTLGLYLKELVDEGVVAREPVGRRSRYEVAEPDRVLDLLVRYRRSFLDRLVDHVLEIVHEAPSPRDGEGRPD